MRQSDEFTIEPIGGWPKTDEADRTLKGWVDIILGAPKLAPHWTCPDCGAEFYFVGKMRFCPACKREEEKLEQKRYDDVYDNMLAGMRSIASDIVDKILAERSQNNGTNNQRRSHSTLDHETGLVGRCCESG